MQNTAKLIFDLGYGDAGKAKICSYLTKETNSKLTVRYNGGAQAAHTVVEGNLKHTFHQFGSGTLQGARTFYSTFALFNPVVFYHELKELQSKGVDVVDKFYLDPQCLLNTLAHQIINRFQELGSNPHGSCGLGIWETIRLHKEWPLISMKAFCLLHPKVLLMEQYESQLRYAISYVKGLPANEKQKDYISQFTPEVVLNEIKAFWKLVQEIREYITFPVQEGLERLIREQETPIIFEGAQGYLLSDKFFEVTPHVSATDCGPANAITLCKEWELDYEVWGVTRTYATRHGYGPLYGKGELKIEEPDNPTNDWQSDFHCAPLDLSLVRSVIEEVRVDNNLPHINLALTHYDRILKQEVKNYYDHYTHRILPVKCILQTPRQRPGHAELELFDYIGTDTIDIIPSIFFQFSKIPFSGKFIISSGADISQTKTFELVETI